MLLQTDAMMQMQVRGIWVLGTQGDICKSGDIFSLSYAKREFVTLLGHIRKKLSIHI